MLSKYNQPKQRLKVDSIIEYINSEGEIEELTAKAEPEVNVDPELEVETEEAEVSLDQLSGPVGIVKVARISRM